MKINRTKEFDLVKFIGKNWAIESENEESLKIKDLDISKLVLHTGLKGNETYITGEERLKRLEGTILLDASIAQTLYEEKGQKTLEEIYGKLGCMWIEFLGTILRDPHGNRRALCLYRSVDGSWSWGCRWLYDDRRASFPALGFESPQSSEPNPYVLSSSDLSILKSARDVLNKIIK